MNQDLRNARSDLSRGDLVDVLEFSDQADRTSSRAGYDALVRRLAHILPVHGTDARVATLDKSNGIVSTSAIVSVNYPQTWIDEYRSRDFRLIDPVAPHLFSRASPLIWSQVRKRFRSTRHRAFYGAAKEYGLRDGFALGQRFAGQASASFLSCISDDLAKHTRHRAVLAWVAPHLHRALGRCTVGPAADHIPLTAREIEVLCRAKDGLTNQEIGIVLSISARAAKFHLENAIKKLGARGRTDAVVIALARGLIDW
jgi:DNA-binding CsgD family transcriptional regulator